MSTDGTDSTDFLREPATNYHHTVMDLRRDLMNAAQLHTQRAGATSKALDEDPKGDLLQALRSSLLGNTMASSYAYTLSALLKVAEKELGAQACELLAHEMDEIITNGDFDDLNADVHA